MHLECSRLLVWRKSETATVTWHALILFNAQNLSVVITPLADHL